MSFIFVTQLSFGQNAKTKHLLNEIKGQWSLDDNGNVTYVRIIKVPNLSKDQIYSRALNYFVYHYGSGKSVIQTQDKEIGCIVAKGLFDVRAVVGLHISCWHIVRVDVKKGKARIILTLTKYEEELSDGHNILIKVAENYPVNPKGNSKTFMGKNFYACHKKALLILDEIEKVIKNGNTSKSIENKKW